MLREVRKNNGPENTSEAMGAVRSDPCSEAVRSCKRQALRDGNVLHSLLSHTDCGGWVWAKKSMLSSHSESSET